MGQKILFIDTETGGLDPLKHSLLTIGAALWEDGTVVDMLSITVAEDDIVAEPTALKINGLSVDEVRATGVTPLQAVQQLHNFLLKYDAYNRKIMVGAHNRQFDMGFLSRLYRLADKEADMRSMYSHHGVCTMIIGVFLGHAGVLKLKGYSGDLLFKYFGCSPERVDGKHEALGDAIAAANAYTAMMRLVKKESLS